MAAASAEAIRMGSRWRKSRFYLAASVVVLAVVLIGFWTTFIRPELEGTFQAPAVIYVHGAFLFLWTLLLLFPSALIQKRKVRLHMSLGYFGIVLAAGVVLSTMAVGVYVMKRDLAAGQGQLAISSLLGTWTTPLVFAVLVAAAVRYRRRPEIHKRLMLLAMIAIIWPAFFRFRHYFPSVPNPDLYFAVLLPGLMVVLAMVWDKLARGRVHTAYLIAGTALIAENLTESFLFNTPPWQTASNWLSSFFI